MARKAQLTGHAPNTGIGVNYINKKEADKLLGSLRFIIPQDPVRQSLDDKTPAGFLHNIIRDNKPSVK